MTTQEFMKTLRCECGVGAGAHVLAAVSGGADSVALLALLRDAAAQMPLVLSCAHVEHGIRGEASREDLAFVRSLCSRWGIAFYACAVDAPGYAKASGCGIEDAARRLRYAFLEETAGRIGAQHIALAHHLGDQAETVLMHAARGSDLRGLGAMRFRRGLLIRPLLMTPPQELKNHLEAIGQPWREDETNGDPAYTRNRIRSQVMPALERAYPGAADALARAALCAQRDEDFICAQLNALGVSREIYPLADGAAVRAQGLCGLHEALKSRMILRLLCAAGASADSAHVARLMEMIDRGSGACALEGGWLARLEGGWLCVTREETPIADIALKPEGETKTPFGVFVVREALEGETGDGIACQVVPAQLLAGASVGARRTGEKMIPFGRKTPVSLKKLMIDAGVPRAMRRSVPVIRGGQGVVWAVGLRPGECCRAGENEPRRTIVFRARECGQIQQEEATSMGGHV